MHLLKFRMLFLFLAMGIWVMCDGWMVGWFSIASFTLLYLTIIIVRVHLNKYPVFIDSLLLLVSLINCSMFSR